MRARISGRQNGWWPALARLGLAALGGAGLALGQAPFSVLPLALVGLICILAALRLTPDARRGVAVGWVAGLAYFAITLHWIIEPFQVDAATYGWMAPFALALLAGGLALFWGVAGWVAGRTQSLIAFALALSAVELLRAFIFTGFPWGLIAGIWLDTPLATGLGWFGPHGLGLVSVAVFAALATPGRTSKLIGAGAGIILVALGIAFAPQAPEIPGDAPVIRLVQPNAPQHLKWDPDWVPVFYRRQINATQAPGSPSLTIWPETSVALRLPRDQVGLEQIAQAANGRPVVLGLNRFEGARVFNSVIALGPSGGITTRYDKAHLVPFGEYVPFGAVLGRFGIHGLADTDGGGYSAGPGPALMDLGALGLALPLVCYEAIFPQFGRKLSAQARVMLHLTNDAWFGDFAGPAQHLAIARLRAIERGVPVIRVANTGVSAMIDATGEITGQIALNVEGFADLPLPPRLSPTFYVKFGEWPFVLLWLTGALGTYLLGRRAKD